MISRTFFFLCLAALLSWDTAFAGRLAQSSVKPPPSLKVPKSSELPPSQVQKTFDRTRNTTYVTIDIPLSAQSRSRALRAVTQASAGELDLRFLLEYKGVSASDLTDASLTISFVSTPGEPEKLSPGGALEVRADAYQYRYADVVHQTEQITNAGDAAPSLRRERIMVKLPLEDLQQIAFANRMEIRLGDEEVQVKSIQLGELRKTLLSHNTN